MSDQGSDYPTSGETCVGKGPLGIFKCQYPAWAEDPEGRCLYHSSENGKTEDAARKVWAEARRKAREPNPNFVGWHFPEDPDAQDFKGATFQANARFWGATFQGEAWFADATFQGDTSFWGATFQRFASFWVATFQGDAWFSGATFQGEATFSGARFEAGVDIRFDTPSLSRWLRGRRPFRRAEQGETAYRLAKQAAQARGDYTEAGQYHYAEQCAIEARWRGESGYRPWRPAFWVWLLRLVFGRIVFGYGERPYYPLFIALAVIACWTGLYWHFDAIDPSPSDEAAIAAPATLGESLYFSMVTFTTLGYGDFKPKPNYRLLAGAEAALGAGLMATFIVCLTRKYMR